MHNTAIAAIAAAAYFRLATASLIILCACTWGEVIDLSVCCCQHENSHFERSKHVHEQVAKEQIGQNQQITGFSML